MTGQKHRGWWLAVVSMAIAPALPCSALAQRGNGYHPAQHQAAPQHPPAPRQQTNPQPAHPGGHAGDWLRRYKDVPPEEQQRTLQNDPEFRKLPPEWQQRLLQRLQHFSSLPPQEQLRMLNRMDTWEHLTPEQKQEARQIFGQMRQLPPDRRRMVITAVRDLRAMPPDQRDKIIDSDRFKGMFSDQERGMMREATRLPLAPAEEEGGRQF
jgi:Protein of unknown function (DUF3106)